VAARHGVPAARIGSVGEVAGRFRVKTAGVVEIDLPVEELAADYYSAIPELMKGE
jgi:hypothetical protein